jgi:hypothetical protein
VRQQQTMLLRSWEGPSANTREGGYKKCGRDVVLGGSKAGKERTTSRRAGV